MSFKFEYDEKVIFDKFPGVFIREEVEDMNLVAKICIEKKLISSSSNCIEDIQTIFRMVGKATNRKDCIIYRSFFMERFLDLRELYKKWVAYMEEYEPGSV